MLFKPRISQEKDVTRDDINILNLAVPGNVLRKLKSLICSCCTHFCTPAAMGKVAPAGNYSSVRTLDISTWKSNTTACTLNISFFLIQYCRVLQQYNSSGCRVDGSNRAATRHQADLTQPYNDENSIIKHLLDEKILI